MWADEVLEEVRRIREEHAARFNYDLRAVMEDLRRRERLGGRTLVNPPTPPAALDAIDASCLIPVGKGPIEDPGDAA